MKMKIKITILLLSLLTNCASYHQLMVSPNGDIQDCYATGQGLIGVAVAQTHTNTCAENLMKAGYLKIEEAGVIGVKLYEDNSMRIIKVAENSPASMQGISPNDKIISIEGQTITTNKDAQTLLFGKAHTRVKLVIERLGTTKEYDLVRLPYNKVYGVKPN